MARDFPDLQMVERGDQLVFSGVYPLIDNSRVVDRYHIEVLLPAGGPRDGIPVVRETASRIPRTSERHMNGDGGACLFVPEDFWYEHPQGMDLLSFLKGPVLAFFVGQSLVERGKPWPYGTRPHGNPGIADFYTEFLGTTDPVRIKACVKLLVAKKLPGHRSCPCGSGRPVRDCHFSTLQQLRTRIPRHVFLETLRRLRSPQIAAK